MDKQEKLVLSIVAMLIVGIAVVSIGMTKMQNDTKIRVAEIQAQGCQTVKATKNILPGE